jgi:hypothetical protein
VFFLEEYMSLYVSIEDREGEGLAEVFEVVGICKRFPETGSCLRFVRETSDASFNCLQSPVLRAELEALVPSITVESEKMELDRLIKICRKFEGKPSTFIRFYGESKGEK